MSGVGSRVGESERVLVTHDGVRGFVGGDKRVERGGSTMVKSVAGSAGVRHS